MRSATYKHCEELIQRISWKKGFPKAQEITEFATGNTIYENPGMDTLVKTLQASAGDDNHAKRILEAIQEEFDACPSPKQLREFALTIQGPEKAKCQACGGSGWTEGYELVQRDSVTGRTRLERRIDKSEYEQKAGELQYSGEGRARKYVPDHRQGVVGTDTASSNFVMRVALRCRCLAGAA